MIAIFERLLQWGYAAAVAYSSTILLLMIVICLVGPTFGLKGIIITVGLICLGSATYLTYTNQHDK